MKTVSILQSNYIPWRGYFSIIASSDEFVFLDTVQSTKSDWRNRNRIKTKQGECWLTIPIRHSSALRIREVTVAERRWADLHLRTLAQSYARAPHCGDLLDTLSDLYRDAKGLDHLFQINRLFIEWVVSYLRLQTRLRSADDVVDERELDLLDPTSRLVEICRRLGAKRYLSGPAAQAYLNEAKFHEAGILVDYADYSKLQPYPQLHGPFLGAVSILDTLFMSGTATTEMLALSS